MLFTFTITLIIGYILSFLSFKYNQHNISSKSRNSIFPILLIVSTISAIIAIIFTSPNNLVSLLSVFSISYTTIFLIWVYITYIQQKIQSAANIDVEKILRNVEEEKNYLIKLIILMKLFQPSSVNPHLDALLKDLRNERSLLIRFKLLNKFFQPSSVNPHLDALLKDLRNERSLLIRFKLLNKFVQSIFHDTIKNFQIRPIEKKRGRAMNIDFDILWFLRLVSIPMVIPTWFFSSLVSIPMVNPTWVLLKYSLKYIAKPDSKNKQKSEGQPSLSKVSISSSNNFAKLFYLIFAIISGLAITKSLESFNMALKIDNGVNEVTNSNQTTQMNVTDGISWGIQVSHTSTVDVIMIICFFMVSIPFIHATAVFLTNTNLIDKQTHRQKAIILHYILLLVETIFLFLVAANVNIHQNSLFLVFLTFMVAVDVLWTIVELSIIKNNNLPLEWMYNNFLMILFLFYFMVYLHSPMFEIESIPENPLVYLILLVIISLRTIINYKVAWKNIYSKGFGLPNS